MLYLVTLPPPLQAGLYSVQEIGPERVGVLINEQRNSLVSRITFPETARILSTIAGFPVAWSPKAPPMERLSDGDMIIQAKLKQGVLPSARMAVDDLEFLLIEYREQ